MSQFTTFPTTIGIAVGAAVAVLLIIGVIVVVVLLLCRKKRFDCFLYSIVFTELYMREYSYI